MAIRPPYLRVIDGGPVDPIRKLLRECVMIHANLGPVPRREHVVALVEQLMKRLRGRTCAVCEQAILSVPRPSATPKLVTVRSMRRKRKMLVDQKTVAAIVSAIKVLIAASRDKHNALGTGEPIEGLAAYGSLYWDLIKIGLHLDNIPTRLRTLTQEQAGPVVFELTTELGISSLHAQALLDAGTKILGNLVIAAVGSAEAMATAIKDETMAKRLAAAKTPR